MDDLQRYEHDLAVLRNAPRYEVPKWFGPDLINIAGRDTITNQPRFRLVFGQDRDAQTLREDPRRFTVLKDMTGAVGFTWMYKYLLGFAKQSFTREFKGGRIIDVTQMREPIGMPYHYIEKFVPARELPGAIWESKMRRFFDTETDTLQDIMGPFPSQGMYVPWLRLKDQKTGKPFPPSEKILEEVRLFKKIEDHYAHLSGEQLSALDFSRQQAEQYQRDMELQDRLGVIFRSYKHQILKTPPVGVLTDKCEPLIKVA